MSKKIVFVGPPKAGKTTLRKVFFEAKNPSNLLKFSLEPTRGQETIILNLNENIGIFDLAGQENEQWLREDNNSIFFNTQLIIVVIDVLTPIEQILSFVNKVLAICNGLNPFPAIYLLIHKIDLVDKTKIRELKYQLNNALGNTNHLKTLFTSIKKEFFTETFSIFITILKKCLSNEKSFDDFDFNLLENLIISFNQIGDEIFISKKDLQRKLNVSEDLINKITQSLDTNGLIQILDLKGNNVISLTEKGKKSFEELRSNYENIFEYKYDPSFTENLQELEIPPFIAFIIAHRSGKRILSLELYEGIVDHITKMNLKEDNKNLKFEFDLFTSFLCALNIFSRQFTFADLSDIKLKALNLKFQIFKYGIYVVIIFMNANTNFKPLEQRISKYFEDLIEKYDKEFQQTLKMAQINMFPYINDQVREWMEKLNKSCENMIENIEIFDIEYAKTLYNKLDDIYNKINVEMYITLKKVRELKMNLLNAILNEDFNKIKTITDTVQDLKTKFGI
ncbi:MAG: GTPase [Promethearchaeota archaeon]